jgi:hypothetical protein
VHASASPRGIPVAPICRQNANSRKPANFLTIIHLAGFWYDYYQILLLNLGLKTSMKFFMAVILAWLFASGCSNQTIPNGSVHAQEPVDETKVVEGHYVFQSQGWYTNTMLVDSGTMEADGAGHILQCSGGSYGALTSPMNCLTHWTLHMGVTDSGQPTNGWYGYGTSDQGDKATIACTQTGKICILTGYNVQWAWTAKMERE